MPTLSKIPRTSLRPTSAETASKPARTHTGSRWLTAALIVLLLASGFLSYQLYKLKLDPSAQGQKQLEQVVKKVGKLVVLPEGETPTLATVTDPEKLKSQPFFANAKVGYQVLLYSKAQKAILYDPKSNKIVEIAPINSSTPTPDTGGETPAATSGNTTTTP